MKVFVTEPISKSSRRVSSVGENAPLTMVEYADRHATSGGLPQQAVLQAGHEEFGVESMLQISQRNRRSRRGFGGLRCWRRDEAPEAQIAGRWRRARRPPPSTLSDLM